MDGVIEAYQRLRNLIQRYRLDDTLAVVRAYSQNLAYDVPFASDLEVLPQYTDPAAGIKQWELEIIARDALAYASQLIDTGRTLRRANNLAALVNTLRSLENEIAGWSVNQGNVLTELHRIAQRQFEWQSDIPRGQLLLRYYKIFSRPALDAIVSAKIGLDTHKLHLIGMHLTAVYLKWFALHYPPNMLLSSKNNVTLQELDIFLKHFSKPVAELSQLIKDELRANMNENYAYFFNSLRAYPLVEMRVASRRSFVAPLPVLVTWRYTRGLYYELLGRPGFAKAFGDAFQAYVGDVLADLFMDATATILPEEPTANNRGVSSSDWFLVVGDAALIVETKTKRMGLAAKIALNDTATLESELGKLADGILQIYKCVDAIRRGEIRGSDYAALQTKRFYPVIVTLESWHVFGPTWQRLNDLVRQRLSAAGLPAEWTDSMPFTACDIAEFEYLARTIQYAGGIGDILDERLHDPALRDNKLYTYLFNNRQTAVRDARELFPNQFDSLFS
jgi:hypothetical protein